MKRDLSLEVYKVDLKTKTSKDYSNDFQRCSHFFALVNRYFEVVATFLNPDKFPLYSVTGGHVH